MKTTLTGLDYEIRIQESQYEQNQLKVRVYEIDRQTFITKPVPVISINTTIDHFAQALRKHYGESPFRHRKEKPSEQTIDSQRTSPTSPDRTLAIHHRGSQARDKTHPRIEGHQPRIESRNPTTADQRLANVQNGTRTRDYHPTPVLDTIMPHLTR